MLVTEKSVRVEPSCSLEKYRNQSSHLQSNQQYSSISQVLAEQPELVYTKLMSLLVTLVVLLRVLLSNYQSSSRILYSAQKHGWNQSVRYRGWIYNFYCTRRSKYQVHSKLDWFWYCRSICFYRNKSYQDLHWYWIAQEILWCSRVCHLQSRRKTTTVLLLWSENCRESYLQSTRRRSTSRLYWRCIRERFTPNNIGTGTVFTSGVSTNSLTKIYIGDGQLFGLGGAAESVTFNPDEKEALFDFTGVGSIRSTRSYIGDGSLFAVNGAAESTVVVPPAEGLFKFSGLATERTSAVETGGGILFNFVTSIERRTFAHSTTGALDISGIADIARAIDYTGFGNLFAVNGAAESTTNRITVEGDIAFSGDAKVVSTRRFIGSGTSIRIRQCN